MYIDEACLYAIIDLLTYLVREGGWETVLFL